MPSPSAVSNQLKNLLNGPVTRGIVRNVNPELVVTGSVVPVAARIYWTRLVEGGLVGAVQFKVVAQAGNICIAYARNVGTGRNAKPGEVIGTTGSFLCPVSTASNISGGANGDQQQSLLASCRPRAGDWVGLAVTNISASFRCTTASEPADSVLALGSSYRETIAEGSPVIPTARAELTPTVTKNWLILGV